MDTTIFNDWDMHSHPLFAVPGVVTNSTSVFKAPWLLNKLRQYPLRAKGMNLQRGLCLWQNNLSCHISVPLQVSHIFGFVFAAICAALLSKYFSTTFLKYYFQVVCPTDTGPAEASLHPCWYVTALLSLLVFFVILLMYGRKHPHLAKN